ncbi:MAG: hypothetical protein J6Y91_00745 [Alphaproteobacteria bacterium]|nr:hypothetical protein [Alphaproteobacteria bacterium]
MVKISKAVICGICLATLPCLSVYAEPAEDEPRFISATSCEDRSPDVSALTTENRAVDQASLAAIKMSGFIQKKYPNLSPSVLDMIAYRIIDDHMYAVNHSITFNDDSHICVKVQGMVSISPETLQQLVEEYQSSEITPQQIAEVAEQVKENTTVKPQNLQDKKLVYIRKMLFWNGGETDAYRDLLTGLFANSTYFYITDKEDVADYSIMPQLVRAEVDEIDKANHKMQMQIRLETNATHNDDFELLEDVQNHFILFAADKDEQEVADGLIKKLLTRAADEMRRKLDKYLAETLESQIRKGQQEETPE